MAQRNQNIFVAATAPFQKKFGKMSGSQGVGHMNGFDISRPAGWTEYFDDQNGTAQPVVYVDATTGITHFANTNGNVFDTAVTLSGGITDSASDALTAVDPGAQSTALLLPSVVNRVTVATANGDGVKLPPAVAGLSIVVVNSSTFALQVYGSGTDTINDVATATGVSQPNGSTVIYWCPKGGVAGKWYSGTVEAYASLTDTNSNPAITFAATPSAVNGLTLTNSATGNGTNNLVSLNASGNDAAVGLSFAPKGAAGVLTLGLATGTGMITLGKSSGAQTVAIGDGAGAATVNIANTGVAGNTVSIAGDATATGNTDTVNIATGNSAGTGAKTVHIADGTPAGTGLNVVTIGCNASAALHTTTLQGGNGAGAISLTPTGAGVITIGAPAGTGDILLGSSSGTQTVRIGNGAGIANTNIAMVTTAGSTTAIAGAATASGLTDLVQIGLGNAVATAFKKVFIATGTPGTTGNNWVVIGGGAASSVTVNGVAVTYADWNVATSVSGNGTTTLTFNLVDAQGTNVALAAGLRVIGKLTSALSAGAITVTMNGGTGKSLKSHFNVANNIATAYASTGVFNIFYDGTQWVDLSE